MRSTARRRRSSRTTAYSAESVECRVLLTAFSLTDNEQLLVELLNRARANPAAEATRYGISLNAGLPAGTISTTPKQPLAPFQSLINAARLHAQDMLDRDYFAHETLGSNATPAQRAQTAGYPSSFVGENIAWGGTTGVLDQLQSVFDRHRSLFLSAGHRQNIMDDVYEDIGVGVRYGVFTDTGDDFNAAMVAESFGTRTVNPIITGVVYTDSNADQFYSVGEAIRSGTITVTNTVSGAVFTETIGVSGGFAVEVPAGTYTVTASYTRAGTVRTVTRAGTLTIASSNVKVDFETAASEAAVSVISVTASTVNLIEATSGQNSTLTISRTGSNAAALTVNLVSSDTTELTVPATVTIPAGQSSVQVTATAVSDNLIDGTQTSVVTVSAPGLTSGTISISVADRTVTTFATSSLTSTTARPVFTWTAISNAATYEIWVNNVTTGQTNVIRQSGITTTSFTSPIDLSIGNYNVWVRGITSSGGLGVWSAPAAWRVRTAASIVNPVQTLTSGNFTVSWGSIPGAVSYEIWVDGLTTATVKYFSNTAVVGTSTNLSGFELGAYGIWVRGRNSAGDVGSWSARANFTVSIAPTGLAVQATLFGATPVLSWSAVPGAAQYDVWVNALTTPASVAVRNTAVTGTSLSLTSLAAGSYRAWVRARDVGGGNYSWSSGLDFQVQRAPVVRITSGTAVSGTPNFTWTAVSGAARYQLWVSNQANVAVINRSDLTQTSWTPSVPLAAGTYRVWVRAIDSTGAFSAWSTALTFTVANIESPQNDTVLSTILTSFQNGSDETDEMALQAHLFSDAMFPVTTRHTPSENPAVRRNTADEAETTVDPLSSATTNRIPISGTDCLPSSRSDHELPVPGWPLCHQTDELQISSKS